MAEYNRTYETTAQEQAHARGLREGRERTRASLLREREARVEMGYRYKVIVGLLRRLRTAIERCDVGWYDIKDYTELLAALAEARRYRTLVTSPEARKARTEAKRNSSRD